MIRLFTPESGVDEEVASRLGRELEELKKLGHEGFVKHYAIRRSSDGLWYRISEWLETESWGSLLASGRLSDRQVLFDLFYQMASILSVLHKEGYSIPHLILNDVMVIEGYDGELKIKIDYKLSRFFDPKLDRPGPMLKRLLDCHPDIVHQRPLDFRSDIWSLGKVFVELLTADLETTEFLSKIEELELPPELDVLLKVMLADDPDMRPRSMAEVASSLAHIKAGEIEKAEVPKPEVAVAPTWTVRRLQKRISLLAIIVIILAMAGFLAWFQLGQRKSDTSSVLEDYANQYAPSVAFLLVEYWLEVDKGKIYRNLGEGTAFLVDQDGYMLSSRHVVCPWLEDMTFYATVQQLKLMNVSPRFGYRMFLWFEGVKAFNRVAQVMVSPELTDAYFVDAAFSTESKPRISIAGIPKTKVRGQHGIASQVKDDFAVLKIDQVPEGLMPLPLDLEMDSQRIPKLSRFITLGFPLGSKTQASTVNVSVTSGHVRRSFENLLQVDASIYAGASGGPVIDTRGMVIGVVSGVALEWTVGLFPTAAPRWNMGMVLPITKAAEFLKELKTGQVKWNGVPDFSVENTVKEIAKTAMEGRWAEAQALADKELKVSLQPPLIMAAGMMHFITGDIQGAKRLFSQALSIDAENYDASLMLFIIDWLAGAQLMSPHRQNLLDLDWRSEGEFQGYLVQVLEGLVDEESALAGWYTGAEKAWLWYVVGLIRSKREDWEGSESLMREAVLSADVAGLELFLAHAKLEQIQKQRRKSIQAKPQRAKYDAEVEAFNQAAQKAHTDKERRQAELLGLWAKLMEDTIGVKDKLQLMENMREMYPDNRGLLAGLAFYSAGDEAWPQALEYIQTFLKEEGRENSNRMSVGLLKAGIQYYQGLEEESRAALKAFVRGTTDPWYLTIGEYLLGKQTEDALKKQAGESPENLVTAYAHLGFWAEGSGDKERAIKHYKEALGSFLDSWLEYNFAKERLTRLRKESGGVRR